jgi:hypothetical protein
MHTVWEEYCYVATYIINSHIHIYIYIYIIKYYIQTPMQHVSSNGNNKYFYNDHTHTLPSFLRSASMMAGLPSPVPQGSTTPCEK